MSTALPQPWSRRIPVCLLIVAIAGAMVACENESTCPTCPECRTEIRGDLDVYGQSEIDALAGIRTIRGDLRVGGSDVNNLRGLGNLRTIEGKFSLSVASVTNFAPLAGLEETRELHITYCDMVRSMAPLSRVRVSETIFIADCDSVRELPAGTVFAEVNRIYLSDLPALTSLAPLAAASMATSITLSDLPSLTGADELADLPSLQTLQLDVFSWISVPDLSGITELRTLRLYDWPNLISLAGIPGHTNLESISITNFSGLTTLSGLSGLPGLKSLSIGSCHGIANPAGLEELSALEILSFTNCNAVQTLDGLPALPALRKIEIWNCSDFFDLSATSAVPWLRQLRMYNLPMLATLTDIGAGIVLDEATFDNCGGITSLAGLRLAQRADLSLRGIGQVEDLMEVSIQDTLGSLSISNCDFNSLHGLESMVRVENLQIRDNSLTNLDGLENLSFSERDLSITSNESLVDMSALAGIDSVGSSLRIGDNTSLDSCVVRIMVDSWAVGSDKLLYNNGPCAR